MPQFSAKAILHLAKQLLMVKNNMVDFAVISFLAFVHCFVNLSVVVDFEARGASLS